MIYKLEWLDLDVLEIKQGLILIELVFDGF